MGVEVVVLEDVNGVRGIGCSVGVGSGDEAMLLPIDGLGDKEAGDEPCA